MKKIHVKTFGCQMNEYDSYRILDLFIKSCEYEETETPEEADVLVLNTCSVREKAKEKIFSQIGMWRKIKESRPGVIIAVGGCVASQEGKDIITRSPCVDIVFGPQTMHRLLDMVDSVLETKKQVVDIAFLDNEKFGKLPPSIARCPSEYVTIMEGCNQFCSYCIVPFTRGKEVSRDLDCVLAEVKTLAEQKVKEVVLLGQIVNSYLGKRQDGTFCDFGQLIFEIAKIQGIERIRFTSSHPAAFNESLYKAYKKVRSLVNHIHLPVQSGSDRILALMKRGHTVESFKKIIHDLRMIRPNITISTDFIVGFPGETDKDFEATLRLIEDVGFDLSYSFVYSSRPGTASAKMEDSVSTIIKKLRLATLQDALRITAHKISESMIGTRQKILVTDFSKQSSVELTGRTENNRVVNFYGEPTLIGNIVDVRITEVFKNCLRGEIVNI